MPKVGSTIFQRYRRFMSPRPPHWTTLRPEARKCRDNQRGARGISAVFGKRRIQNAFFVDHATKLNQENERNYSDGQRRNDLQRNAEQRDPLREVKRVTHDFV